MDALITAADAAYRFHTSIAVILMWRNRGWIDADGEHHYLGIAGWDWRNRPLYRWRDLLTAECGARQSRQRAGLPQRAWLDNPYERSRTA